MFGCLSLHWRSAGLSGRKPFPGKRPALDAVFGSADVIKRDIKNQAQQTPTVSNTSWNNSAANKRGSAEIFRSHNGQQGRNTGERRRSARTVGSLQGHTHKSYTCECENPAVLQQGCTQKTKEQRKHRRAGWSLPPTETSPRSVKANTRGRENHYRHF